jgi:hypothetical protein
MARYWAAPCRTEGQTAVSWARHGCTSIISHLTRHSIIVLQDNSRHDLGMDRPLSVDGLSREHRLCVMHTKKRSEGPQRRADDRVPASSAAREVAWDPTATAACVGLVLDTAAASRLIASLSSVLRCQCSYTNPSPTWTVSCCTLSSSVLTNNRVGTAQSV